MSGQIANHWQTYHNDVLQIMNELKDVADPFFYTHMRVYKNGGFYLISNHLSWNHYQFVQKKLPPSCLTNFSQTQSGVFFPSLDKEADFGLQEGVFRYIKDNFNLQDFMLMIQKQETFLDVNCFAVNKPNPYSDYTNNLSLYENFIHMFKGKAQNILKVCDAKLNTTFAHLAEDMPELEKQTRANIIFPCRHYSLYYNNSEYMLTNKEYHVLHFLAHGMKSKEIASHLQRGCKTIETHIDNMKKKTGLVRSQLIEAYWNSRLIY